MVFNREISLQLFILNLSIPCFNIGITIDSLSVSNFEKPTTVADFVIEVKNVEN